MIRIVEFVDPLESVEIPESPGQFVECVLKFRQIDVGRTDVRDPESLWCGRGVVRGSGRCESGQRADEQRGKSSWRHAHGTDVTGLGRRVSKRDDTGCSALERLRLLKPEDCGSVFAGTGSCPPRGLDVLLAGGACDASGMFHRSGSPSCAERVRSRKRLRSPGFLCRRVTRRREGLLRQPFPPTTVPGADVRVTAGRPFLARAGHAGQAAAPLLKMPGPPSRERARGLAPPAKGGASSVGGRSMRCRRTRVALTGGVGG